MDTLNFPLILTILVFGTGIIWLVDHLLFKPKRDAVWKSLQKDLPQWHKEGSSDQEQFIAAVKRTAAEPIAVEYSRSLFPVLALVFVLRSFIVEPFQIPSGSMIPTLEIGDFILVNKFTYGIRLPVVRTKVLDINEPKRGDVMVFFPPGKKQYYIKRVIGVPGDIIEYRNKVLTINGEVAPQELIAELPPWDPKLRLARETLGDNEHQIQMLIQPNPRGESSFKVQEGHYFMMGDNRDNSNDSRFWGQVPEENIVGKAFAIWMHWEQFLSIPSFDRTGLIK